jgi:N utilization substance protein B
MSSRRYAREVALQILYQLDVDQTPVETPLPELTEMLKKHFEHFRIEADARTFAAELVLGTRQRLPELDQEISNRAAHWKLPRMAVIDRNLLRLGLFELRHYPDTPHRVTLDEAVELAKSFGSADTSSFVNAILDAAMKDLPLPGPLA